MGKDWTLIGEHTKQIKAASRRLDKARQRADEANEERRKTICEAFAAGLTAEQISRAAGLGIDRVRQIKAGTRGGQRHTNHTPEPLL